MSMYRERRWKGSSLVSRLQECIHSDVGCDRSFHVPVSFTGEFSSDFCLPGFFPCHVCRHLFMLFYYLTSPTALPDTSYWLPFTFRSFICCLLCLVVTLSALILFWSRETKRISAFFLHHLFFILFPIWKEKFNTLLCICIFLSSNMDLTDRSLQRGGNIWKDGECSCSSGGGGQAVSWHWIEKEHFGSRLETLLHLLTHTCTHTPTRSHTHTHWVVVWRQCGSAYASVSQNNHQMRGREAGRGWYREI